MTKKQIENLTPYSGTVDIVKILNDIESYIINHTILPKGASSAIALWCLATYLINTFNIFPKLTIYSPEKRCGKSTVLDILEAFCCKSCMTSNISAAAIYRMIEESQPTLIIDEADTFVAGGSNKDMVGIINSGHAKNRAYVSRCVGDDYQAKNFSTWSPMVLASIGSLQPTIMDRSIAIQINRKTATESVKRIQSDLFDAAKVTRSRMLKWSNDNADTIKQNIIEPKSHGNDRAVDNWIPLFTIAKLVSKNWLKKCEASYIFLTDFDEDLQPSTLLLEDIRQIFSDHDDVLISSADLVRKLNELEDQPWCEWKNGKSMSKYDLAIVLKKYNIKPKGIRYKGKTPKGYRLDQFKDAFERYLPTP